MLLATPPQKSIHQVEIQTYQEYIEGGKIRFASTSTLLADTLFSWFGERLETAESIQDLKEQCAVIEPHYKLFDALINILVKSGYLTEKEGVFKTTDFNREKLRQRAEAIREKGLLVYGKEQWLFDAVGPSFDLARACILELPKLLSGEISSTQLLFSAENYERSTAIYSAHLQEVYYSLIAEQIIDSCHRIWRQHPTRQIRILEIGAGSGRGTIRMLEGLREYGDKIHFSFTDIGSSFLRRAKRTFRDFDCDLNYQLLDISREPTEQGFAAASYDIAFATNVLHATSDLRATLANVHKLLRPGGGIFINEIAQDMAVNTVSYGATPGWWLPQDGLRLPHSPVVSTTTFRDVLDESGFRAIEVVGYPEVPENELVQAIIQGIKK